MQSIKHNPLSSCARHQRSGCVHLSACGKDGTRRYGRIEQHRLERFRYSGKLLAKPFDALKNSDHKLITELFVCSEQVGLALPFFIETAIIYPGTNASINSKGLFYAMILLWLSLLVTIYLFYMNQWILNKKLGIMMIIAYFVILLVSFTN